MRNGNEREVVIVEAVRTPIGRGHPEKGYYKDTHPNELLGKTYSEVIERAGIEPSEVEDVITGCVQQYGEQMFNVGRNAWLQAGLPVETPATTVDRQCGSAQQAVNFAAALIASGVHDVAIGSGVEHMGHIPMGVGFKWVDDVGSPWPPEILEKYNLVPQGISAEIPWGTRLYFAISSSGQGEPTSSTHLKPTPIGTWPMCSTPAPIMMSCVPDAIRPAA